MAALPTAFGVACGSSQLALQLVDPAQPHRGSHLVDWGSALLGWHGMDAELLQSPRWALDAIGIPVPERGAEVAVLRLLGVG